MEDGGKEDTAKPKEVKFTGKAGWLKKSSGGFFGSYKDRYLQLEHTEVGVYENEDLKNCLERLDLENYEKCHELRGAFKKKNRLILIKAPKCVNKVHDVKLQAQSQEDKEAWIKALSDGISRAKNKIFDEVKVDEGNSLEHVTRTRPKGNRGRRPPTRIHMKEVANVSSDGILRLDLDVTDSPGNGTFHINTEEGTRPDRVTTITGDGPKDEPTSEEPTPQKKILKPPMPPSKQIKPVSVSEEDTHGETTSDSGVDTGAPPTPSKPSSSQDDLSSDSSSVDKDPKPPKPPSKEKKPTLVEEKEEKEAKETPEAESEVKDKEETEEKTEVTTEAAQNKEQDKPTDMDDLPPKVVLKPPVVMWDTPLTETSTEAEQADVSKETQSTPEPLKKTAGPADASKETQSTPEPLKKTAGPADASKETQSTPEPLKETAGPTDVSKETQSTPEPLKKTSGPTDVSKETQSTPELLKKTAGPPDVSKETQSTPEPLKKTAVPPDVSKETQSTPEPLKKAVGPPAPPKKKPVKCPVKSEDSKQPCDAKKDKGEEKESSSSELISKSAKTEAQSETNTLSKSPEPSTESEVVPPARVSEEKVEPCVVSVGKVEQEEEKSVDSGQHSAEESENGDATATSTTALLGSQAKLDEDSSEADETEPSNAQSENTSEGPSTSAGTPSGPQEEPCGFDSPALPPSMRNRPQIVSPRPIVPLKPSAKVRSASVGDLLAEPPQEKQQAERKESGKSAERDMKDLESKMTLEIKNTGDLLHTVSDQQNAEGENQDELTPEVLLATAMEKLRKAEEILSVAKSLKGRKGSESKRVSW